MLEQILDETAACRRALFVHCRTSDPHSASSQFFINVGNNDILNYPGQDGWGYVFGKVINGMDVVDKIKTVPTSDRASHQNVPTDPVIIEKAECA